MTEYGARSWTPMSRCDPLFADTDGMAEAKNTTTKSKPFYKSLFSIKLPVQILLSFVQEV